MPKIEIFAAVLAELSKKNCPPEETVHVFTESRYAIDSDGNAKT
jgi:hypothetical protein